MNHRATPTFNCYCVLSEETLVSTKGKVAHLQPSEHCLYFRGGAWTQVVLFARDSSDPFCWSPSNTHCQPRLMRHHKSPDYHWNSSQNHKIEHDVEQVTNFQRKWACPIRQLKPNIWLYFKLFFLCSQLTNKFGIKVTVSFHTLLYSNLHKT